MTEVSRYRDGELSSTALLERAMEESGAAKKGEAAKLDWHADHAAWAQERDDLKSAPSDAVLAGVVGFAVGQLKGAVKVTPDWLNHPKECLKDAVKAGTTFATRLLTAEGTGVVVIGAGAVVAGAEVVHAIAHAEKLERLSNLDAIDVAATAMLDLDVGFKQADMAKHPGILPEKIVAHFTGTDFGREHRPELQACADAGSRAAFAALRCGGREDYFRMHPDAASRYRDDVAFNKGFECVMWCASQDDGANRLQHLEAGIHQRDARASTPQIVRG